MRKRISATTSLLQKLAQENQRMRMGFQLILSQAEMGKTFTVSQRAESARRIAARALKDPKEVTI